ncbi:MULTISPECIES: DUF3426 domain-containing protein [unclassified Lysobacter]|uniref:DUF3426 domain-containing protein n=1 Tax=unclassified Lysobacter TaxID=2635362 RepID=UPI001BE9CC27|nr:MULTISPECIES: DUF3426 domain-containing protein [unclassified Lysobacter]MBT2746298.1 DUF3426 domain-containing protein [Lysobacter sp. ISL-42]MBT2751229.1 DUF3426 domain-containing protein [Lysobacter sp. ISL-50]MBT2775637.1 DUF3426 domain-containing protein [Lysobacter sp. ISL-54]MBT2780022.1 DUF3426 domain-containing protein [Lysobacter sp. ISL-52]
MFVACPHCGYLVALIVAKDGPPRTCPRCNGALQSEPADAGDAAAATPLSAEVEPGATPDPPDPPAATPVAPTAAHAIEPGELRRPGTVATTQRAPKPPLDTPAASAGADASAEREIVIADVGDDDAHQAGDESTPAAAHADAPADSSSSDPSASTEPPVASAQIPSAPLPPLTEAAPAPARPAKRGAARNGKPETAVSSGRRAPSFARQQARARAAAPRMHWSGPLLAVALTLILSLQLLLAQRDELAADARWRPLVATLCGVLPCEIPPWREPAALTMLNRNVLPVADRAGVLRVSAGFRNDARWPQPWPTLVLSLEDVDGRRVGQRAFSPRDYRKGFRPQELIAPGQSAAVQFDVREPAPHVVAFTFDFR